MKLSRAHQAWVSDITYIRTQEGFVYLSLVMDAHSRKIVGFHAGNSLEVEGCLRALGKAIADEWRAQHDTIKPDTMPLTSLANAAIDVTGPNRLVGGIAVVKLKDAVTQSLGELKRMLETSTSRLATDRGGHA